MYMTCTLPIFKKIIIPITKNNKFSDPKWYPIIVQSERSEWPNPNTDILERFQRFWSNVFICALQHHQKNTHGGP